MRGNAPASYSLKPSILFDLPTMPRIWSLFVSALALSVSLLALAGCRREATLDAARAQTPAAVPVKSALVVGQDEPVTLQATGSFVADEDSDVAPDASG